MVSHAKIVWVLPEFLWHYCCFELFDFSNLVLWIFSLWFVSADAELFTMEFSGLHYCLFVKEHRCFLSRQLVYNITGLLRCQQLFLFFQRAILWFARWIFMLSHTSTVCQYLLPISLKFSKRPPVHSEKAQKKKSQSLKILFSLPIGSETEKEGFEPSRRLPDLHP